jgi:hypothetical protein
MSINCGNSEMDCQGLCRVAGRISLCLYTCTRWAGTIVTGDSWRALAAAEIAPCREDLCSCGLCTNGQLQPLRSAGTSADRCHLQTCWSSHLKRPPSIGPAVTFKTYRTVLGQCMMLDNCHSTVASSHQAPKHCQQQDGTPPIEVANHRGQSVEAQLPLYDLIKPTG